MKATVGTRMMAMTIAMAMAIASASFMGNFLGSLAFQTLVSILGHASEPVDTVDLFSITKHKVGDRMVLASSPVLLEASSFDIAH